MASSENNHLHFVIFPYVAPGHMIPMIDIAKLLAQRGATVTIFTTPVNAARFTSTLARAEQDTGLPIRVVQLKFPSAEAGLPDGCENVDMLPSLGLFLNVLSASNMLQEQAENLFQKLTPPPSCIISDMCVLYTSHLATQFQIPRISFHGFGCFTSLCYRICLRMKKDDLARIADSESDRFLLPGLPDKIEFTKAQLPLDEDPAAKDVTDEMVAIDLASYGAIVNTFEEIEPEYVKECVKGRGGKIWCVGPVSLCNTDKLDKAQRGNDASLDEHQYLLNWLDSQEPTSVLYACLGSLCNLVTEQLIELGLGLEASEKPFIWVIKGSDKPEQLEKWISESGFDERIKGKGLLIRGFAPQVLILSHPAIGGFLTHCGWNSILEGVCAGVPLMTWPLFDDQFCNEKVVLLQDIGVRVGVERPMIFGQEKEIGVLVTKEDVKHAVDKLMDVGEEGSARRERARKLGELATRAVAEGGSSHLNTTKLIEDVMQQVKNRNQGREF